MQNCPEVELTPTGVKIGEEGNLATLAHKEWNLLVDLIHSGELKKSRYSRLEKPSGEPPPPRWLTVASEQGGYIGSEIGFG